MIKSGSASCNSPLRKVEDVDSRLSETPAADSFDISVMRDLQDFFTVIVVKQQHLGIFRVLDVKGYMREFAYNFSKQYISQHKILSKFCEVCQMTKQLGVNTAIYVNGLEFKQKFPKLGLGGKADEERGKRGG